MSIILTLDPSLMCHRQKHYQSHIHNHHHPHPGPLSLSVLKVREIVQLQEQQHPQFAPAGPCQMFSSQALAFLKAN